MSKMKAYRLVEWGKPAEFADVKKPSPGPTEILIKMRGAGLCRSDLDIMAGGEPYAAHLPAGFTLGHENTGIVAGVGQSVSDLSEGDAVAVHHIHSCGYCAFCLKGIEPHCETYARGPINMTRGCGIDGGLAEYLLVNRHEVVSLGALDPVKVAPLTDAGVTAYHAVANALPKLTPGTTSLVIGIGGLGDYGVQLLKLLSSAKIIALDKSPDRLTLARLNGADLAIESNAQAYERIMDETGGRGADVVFDYVGTQATLELAAKVSRPQGRIVLIGLEGGEFTVGWGRIATSCEFVISLGSTRADLLAVCELAAQDKLKIESNLFEFNDVETAFDRLRNGDLKGRAVVAF